LKSDYAEDSRQYTVMSYWDEYETGAHFQGAYAGAPLLHDISAMQYLYGANTTTRTGDDVYGFNSNTGIDYYTATSSNDKLIFSVWDSGGNDTFDFSGYYQDQVIDLREGHFSDVGGLQKNVSIAQGVTIENAIGGSGNDIIYGNDADNILIGGGGQDTLWGGTGSNTFVYKEISDSLVSAADKIMDFKSGIDKIDLSELIENTFSHKFLNFVDKFTGHSGEATIKYNQSTNSSELAINAYGYDSSADFKIDIVGFVNYETDFIV
ncbi:M10 family metallopeptidase C-terminal domain-containing protein, partial [Proteus vulgaris]